ncbi:MAG: FAD binding domain-containing protein [Betaproteobacteria bacterium]
MKATAFDYERPGDLDAVIMLTAREDLAVKIIAGGQSLGPMLNLRLAQPDVLVDITHVPELKRVEQSADALTLGACITHADIEDGRVPDATAGALAGVARDIAYRVVRNRGTLGGSLAHADPAADWVSALAAMDAEVLVRGPEGQRTLPVAGLMTGAFETMLAAGELIEAVRVPRFSSGARWGYYKIARKTGEMAQAIGAFFHDPGRGVCRAVMGATESVPIVFENAAALFGGNAVSFAAAKFDSNVAAQALAAAGIIDAVDRKLHITALRRAVERAAPL